MKELEDGILEQLANAEGDVTENIELIENLEDSKRRPSRWRRRWSIAKETEKIINRPREMYRPVANRGSLMFFLLSDLFKIHTFHLYSLASFSIVLTRAVTGKRPGARVGRGGSLTQILPERSARAHRAEAEAAAAAASGGDDSRPEELQKRLDYLVENITYEVFNYARRGLFDEAQAHRRHDADAARDAAQGGAPGEPRSTTSSRARRTQPAADDGQGAATTCRRCSGRPRAR